MENKKLDDLKDFIVGLSTIKGVGSKTVKVILDSISNSIDKFLKLSEEELLFILSRNKLPFANRISKKITENREILLDIGKRKRKELKKKKIDLLLFNELPQKLKEIPDAPYWLFTQGNKDLLLVKDKLFIAVIGTRNASFQGKRFTKRVIQALSIYPVIIVSGLAGGIDEAAHAFSLEKNIPNIAFLGSGIEIVFPKKTKYLRNKILESEGVVVSEYLPKENYAKYKFVRRNRLQAAISDLLIPIEANEKSGTAHTIRFGIKYNKLIWGIKLNSGIEKILKERAIPIFDIKTGKGLKDFDCELQSLIKNKKIPFDKVSKILSFISNTLRLRCFSNEDKERLIKEIEKLIEPKGGKNDKSDSIPSESYPENLF